MSVYPEDTIERLEVKYRVEHITSFTQSCSLGSQHWDISINEEGKENYWNGYTTFGDFYFIFDDSDLSGLPKLPSNLIASFHDSFDGINDNMLGLNNITIITLEELGV